MSELIKIKNTKEVNDILGRTITRSKYIIYTTGNSWYIDTLIHNLCISLKVYEPDIKLIIFCTDKEGVEKCKNITEIEHYQYVDIPDLGVNTFYNNTDATTVKYTLLSFVKTVLMRHILDQNYIPIFLDPDMALKMSCIDDLISYSRIADFVCAGSSNHINTNIMIANDHSKSLFSLTKEDVRKVCEASDLFGDEDYIRINLKNYKYICVFHNHYPNGNNAMRFIDQAKIIHANCVVGLNNKINLLRMCDAWYLDGLMPNEFINIPIAVKFPPKMEGYLIEQYFYNYVLRNNPIFDRIYINVAWTNLYCNKFFKSIDYNEKKLQTFLDRLPRKNKYFTVCQYSEKIKQRLPPDTIVYGGSVGNLPLPLLYENHSFFNNLVLDHPRDILCSYIAQTNTHPLRKAVQEYCERFDDYFVFNHNPVVQKDYDTNLFFEKTSKSKFCIAPRGFGRSSFRFFEAIKLNTIPVYIYDDIIWLPFQDTIDYSKFSIIINIKDLEKLDSIIRNITGDLYLYEQMLSSLIQHKHFFTFENVSKQISKEMSKVSIEEE